MKPEDIARILDDLGTRIGPAGEYVWQLTVKQVLIDAWLWGAFGILPFLDRLVIEQVASFGMAVGAEVFETVYWSGRFAEAVYPLPVDRITRIKVKTHLCHDSRAKDANIRAALIDRYGGPAALRKGGDLYGVSKDVWSALAVAVTWADQHR